MGGARRGKAGSRGDRGGSELRADVRQPQPARVKTDRRDARTLAVACRLGYRPAHWTSTAQRTVRAQLAVRQALVRTRTRYISVLRAGLRRDGVRVPSGGASPFGPRVQALALSAPPHRLVAPLLACSGPSTSRPSWRRSSRAGVAGHAAGRRLCTVPGVGPVTAAAVVATLDDVGRFVSAGRWRSSDSSFCAPACGASDGRDDDGAARQGTHGSHHTRGDGRLAAPLRIRSGMLPAGKHSRRTTTGSQFRSAEALQCHGPSYSPSSCS